MIYSKSSVIQLYEKYCYFRFLWYICGYISAFPFGFVPFTEKRYVPDSERGQVLLPDFHYFQDILMANKQKLQEGRSFSEILLGIPDEELFPELTEHERPFAVWMQHIREGRSVRERF